MPRLTAVNRINQEKKPFGISCVGRKEHTMAICMVHWASKWFGVSVIMRMWPMGIDARYKLIISMQQSIFARLCCVIFTHEQLRPTVRVTIGLCCVLVLAAGYNVRIWILNEAIRKSGVNDIHESSRIEFRMGHVPHSAHFDTLFSCCSVSVNHCDTDKHHFASIAMYQGVRGISLRRWEDHAIGGKGRRRWKRGNTSLLFFSYAKQATLHKSYLLFFFILVAIAMGSCEPKNLFGGSVFGTRRDCYLR